MYNTVKLDSKHWCLQRYLWEPSLDPNIEPLQIVIKTVIYGVKSSGNQAECTLRKTAELFKDDYPLVFEVIMKDSGYKHKLCCITKLLKTSKEILKKLISHRCQSEVKVTSLDDAQTK